MVFVADFIEHFLSFFLFLKRHFLQLRKEETSMRIFKKERGCLFLNRSVLKFVNIFFEVEFFIYTGTEFRTVWNFVVEKSTYHIF